MAVWAKPVSFSIVQHSHDNWPVAHTLEWPVLAERLARHDEATEKDGVALICATFTQPPRGKETLAERHLIGIDIEVSKKTGEVPPPPSMIAGYLAMKRLAAVMWTTFGHTPDMPRYRVVLPLDKPFRPLEVGRKVEKMMTQVAAANIQLNGRYDEGKLGGESLFYLARHAPGTSVHWSTVIEGAPVGVDDLIGVSRMILIGVQMKQAQRDALKKTSEFPAELKALIEAYNDGHELADLFSQYGYMRMGDRWKSRYQDPRSTAATAIFPDHSGWYSWSDSDKSAGLGHINDDGIFGDAFSLYVHYEHGGNFRAAVAALREHYGAQGSPG